MTTGEKRVRRGLTEQEAAAWETYALSRCANPISVAVKRALLADRETPLRMTRSGRIVLADRVVPIASTEDI
jgi:hypothetical protein